MKHEALRTWRLIEGHTHGTMADLLDVTKRRYRDMESQEGNYDGAGDLWLDAVRALKVRHNLTMLLGRLDAAGRGIAATGLKPGHGWYVRAARIVLGQGQRTVAHRIGVDHSELCRFERGNPTMGPAIYRNGPRGPLITLLAKACDLIETELEAF